MHQIKLPADAEIRLTATATRDLESHRWTMRVMDALEAAGPARLSYGSHIGGRDCDQRIHIPIQDRDCLIDVTCDRETSTGWLDQAGAVREDTPALLVIDFSGAPGPEPRGVVLSFAFSAAATG